MQQQRAALKANIEATKEERGKRGKDGGFRTQKHGGEQTYHKFQSHAGGKTHVRKLNCLYMLLARSLEAHLFQHGAMKMLCDV